jgi:sortase A
MRRLRLAGNVLIAAGALLLAVAAANVAIGIRAQAGGVSPAVAFPISVSPASVAPASAPAASPIRELRRPAKGEAVGRLEIPRLELDLVVFEGVSAATLRKGPAHLPGTAWPGGPDEGGNCVIAGHRDTFFRRLVDARKGDLVLFRGPSGTSIYRLGARRIVRPQDMSAIAPTSDARLTLITCYPFSWTGSAPYRLVWEATRLEPESPPGESARISERQAP